MFRPKGTERDLLVRGRARPRRRPGLVPDRRGGHRPDAGEDAPRPRRPAWSTPSSSGSRRTASSGPASTASRSGSPKRATRGSNVCGGEMDSLAPACPAVAALERRPPPPATGQFKRDYRRESRGRHGAFLDSSLVPVVEILANDHPLEARHHDHGLSGEWRGPPRLPREAGPGADEDDREGQPGVPPRRPPRRPARSWPSLSARAGHRGRGPAADGRHALSQALDLAGQSC